MLTVILGALALFTTVTRSCIFLYMAYIYRHLGLMALNPINPYPYVTSITPSEGTPPSNFGKPL